MSRNNRTPTNSDVFSNFKIGNSALSAASEDGSPLEEARLLPIDQVQPNPNQPRKKNNPELDDELAKDIEERGILQPIIVRLLSGKGNRYEIIAGERRWRAAKKAGLDEVPVIIKDFDDQEAQFVSLVENLQRLDLDPQDEAVFFHKLETDYNMSQRQIAKMIHRSPGYVTNRIASLNNPASMPAKTEPTSTTSQPNPVHERPKITPKTWSYRPQNFQRLRSYIGETLDNWQSVETGQNRENLLNEVATLKAELTQLEKKLKA